MAYIAIGDWVRTTKTIPTTLTDHLTNTGIARGTKGVVTAGNSSRLTVDFDTGWGICTATVDTRHITRVRRAGGADTFRRRAHNALMVRIGLALALAFPAVYFTAWYVWTHHTLTGLIPAFLQAALAATEDLVVAAFDHPVQTVLYLALTGALSRWVWHTRR